MGNKSSSNSKVHGQAAKVASTEPQHVPRQGKVKASTKANMVGFPTDQGHGTKGTAALRDEYVGEPKAKAETPGGLRGQHGVGVHSEQQCKAPLDNDDTFTSFIRRTKYKIRSVTMSKSKVDREQSNTAPADPTPDETNGTNCNENDQFSDFIRLAKKKLRTTSSSIGKNGSSKRG